MPAEFKAFIERKYGKGFNTFYITSMDGESAEIYPLPEWLERQKKIFAMPQSNPARRILLDPVQPVRRPGGHGSAGPDADSGGVADARRS